MIKTAPCLVLCLAAAALIALVACGPPPGCFPGTVYVRQAGGGTGPPLAGAQIEVTNVRRLGLDFVCRI